MKKGGEKNLDQRPAGRHMVRPWDREEQQNNKKFFLLQQVQSVAQEEKDEDVRPWSTPTWV